jgi:hypothetical protein
MYQKIKQDGTIWLMRQTDSGMEHLATYDAADDHVVGDPSRWAWTHPKGVMRYADSKLLHRCMLGIVDEPNTGVKFTNGNRHDCRRANMTAYAWRKENVKRTIPFINQSTGKTRGISVERDSRGSPLIMGSWRNRRRRFSVSKYGRLEAYKLAIRFRLECAAEDGIYFSLPCELQQHEQEG